MFGTVLYTAAWRRNAAVVRNDIASYDAWSGVPCVERSGWGPFIVVLGNKDVNLT